MQAEITLTILPDRNAVKFKMDARNLSVLLNVILDAFENGSIQQRLKELENELDAESDIFSRLARTISSKLASDFKAILQKNGIAERAVCAKYGVDSIEEMTGGDVLDVLAEIIRSNQKRNQ